MRTPLLSSCLVLLGAALPVTSAFAAPTEAACLARDNNSFAKVLECVSTAGVAEHLAALQAIADANDGTRMASTAGFDATGEYITDVLEAAGYRVTVDPFEFLYDGPQSDPIFEQTSPVPTSYELSADYLVAKWSGSGSVAAPVQGVDLNLGGTASDSGCDASDFAGFIPGNIALIRRGTCIFQDKVDNAEAAGASAVILFNQGNSESRMGLLKAILDYQVGIPVIFVSYDLGVELAGGADVALDIDWLTEPRDSYNLFAQTRRGSTTNVVMAGGHFDSVQAGPGINDNGTGVAALLEIAQNMANLNPTNAVRFAFWSAEEFQVSGSYDWVIRAYDSGELDKVAVYLNYDMIGSPNYVRYVYEDDGNPGTAAVTDLYHRYFDVLGLDVEEVSVYGRSDTYGFQDAGWPTGGVFTGAEGLKTDEEAAIFGGVAGEPYDACYHQACDTYDNVDMDVLHVMLDAAAVSILQYAMNTQAVNGVAGRPTYAMERFELNLSAALAR